MTDGKAAPPPNTITKTMIGEAWKRIGNSSDGRLVRYSLAMDLLQGIPTGLGQGAVFEEVGGHRVKREILTLLDAGGNLGGPEPVTILREPGPAAPPGGSRRRVPERE